MTTTLLGLTLAMLPSLARAGEPEAIRLTLEAPPACLDEAELLAQVEALGVKTRAVREGERARTFTATVAPENEQYTARLSVRDLVGETTSRTVTSARCSDAARSLALLVALALDDAEAAHVDSDAASPSLSPAIWPSPARGDEPTGGTIVGRRRREGSGGIVLSGVYGYAARGEGLIAMKGAHAYAAARLASGTRVGASLAVASEGRGSVIDNDVLFTSRGLSGRAGAIVGWGAPWDDSVVGFLGEAGVAVGRQTGSGAPRDPAMECGAFFVSECYDETRATPSRLTSVSPYLAAAVVLQIPWKAPVRPVAAFTNTATFGGAGVLSLACTAELGVVWQAW